MRRSTASQKTGREIHLESRHPEWGGTVIQKPGRDTHPERSAESWTKSAVVRRQFQTLISGSSGSLFTSGQLSSFFLRTSFVLGPYPRCMSNVSLRWIVGAYPHLLWGGGSLLFQPPRSLSAHVQAGKFSLISGAGTLSLYFSSAQLLPLASSLGCLGENKAWLLLHLINTSRLAQEPICLLPRSHRLDSICPCLTGLAPLLCTVNTSRRGFATKQIQLSSPYLKILNF